MSQTDDMPGSQVSNTPETDSFAVSFMHVELKREWKEKGEKKQGTG